MRTTRLHNGIWTNTLTAEERHTGSGFDEKETQEKENIFSAGDESDFITTEVKEYQEGESEMRIDSLTEDQETAALRFELQSRDEEIEKLKQLLQLATEAKDFVNAKSNPSGMSGT